MKAVLVKVEPLIVKACGSVVVVVAAKNAVGLRDAYGALNARERFDVAFVESFGVADEVNLCERLQVTLYEVLTHFDIGQVVEVGPRELEVVRLFGDVGLKDDQHERSR